jgi:hypothetical protein
VFSVSFVVIFPSHERLNCELKNGWSRIERQRDCCTLQFLYSRLGPIASRAIPCGGNPVCFGDDSVVVFVGLDRSPLVDTGRSLVQPAGAAVYGRDNGRQALSWRRPTEDSGRATPQPLVTPRSNFDCDLALLVAAEAVHAVTGSVDELHPQLLGRRVDVRETELLVVGEPAL